MSPRRPDPWRPGRLTAPAGHRKEKPRLEVFTDAKVTEPGWLTWLKQRCEELTLDIQRRPGVSIERIAKDCENAAKKASKDRRGDEVWLVIDWDADGEIKDKQKALAIQICQQAGAGIVLSWACFELWPLLHLGELGGDHSAAELQRQLAQKYRRYCHKSAPAVNWSQLTQSPSAENSARDRALRLHRANMATHGDPTKGTMTTAWLLTERVRHPTDAKASWFYKACEEARLEQQAREVLRSMLPKKLRSS